MADLIVNGGKPLSGTITPSGNKNSVLPILCATLLTDEPVALLNVPDITDKLRQAVYASGVARPKQASAMEMQQLEQQAMIAAQQQAAPMQPVPQTGYADPMAGTQVMPPTQPATGPQYGRPAASVSTFGGPDGSGGQ